MIIYVLMVAALLQTEAEPVATSRIFLDALATNPVEAEKLAAKGARIAVGDIGGYFADYVKSVRPKSEWLTTCRAGRLTQKPDGDYAELTGDDSQPGLKGSKVSVVEGAYDCTRPDGSKVSIRISVILKDQQVVMVGLWGPK